MRVPLIGTAKRLARAVLARGPAYAVARARALAGGAVTVLMYHTLGSDDEAFDAWTVVRRSEFLRQVEWLRAHYEVVTLDAALATVSGVLKLTIETARDEGHPVTNPEADVAANHLAYIYFTSGSTGEPKGAMCEHAGMLNHLLAKIDDLRIGAGTVVAQTAPQCFDISLWQLLSALLVGGRTLLVEQEEIFDPGRFIDVVVTGWPRERDSRIVARPEFGAVTGRLWECLREESLKALGHAEGVAEPAPIAS